MRLWIVETRGSDPAGHEVNLNSLLINELSKLNNKATLILTNNHSGSNYNVNFLTISPKTIPLPEKSLFGSIKRLIYRELNRHYLFLELNKLSEQYDILIFPSTNYRFIRSLRFSRLKYLNKPIVFLCSGSLSQNKTMAHQLNALPPGNQIKALVNTIEDEPKTYGCPNYFVTPPPAFIPMELDWRLRTKEDLVFGFFGQYRREKKIENLFEAILRSRIERPVKFLIQLRAANKVEQTEAEAIARTYSEKDERLNFIFESLHGTRWEEALLSVNAILLPYSSDRFLWSWAGMIFTAIGFRRPVLAPDNLNPTVLARFKIGRIYRTGDLNSMTEGLEKLVTDFDDPNAYQNELKKAFDFYHPYNLAQKINKIIDINKN
jgi:glycosyltransferase involved in cell wall biosynthesis